MDLSVIKLVLKTVDVGSIDVDVAVFYYTFSTIAQTLAAAFAFVGAFVLFRLQYLSKTLKSFTEFEYTIYNSNIKNLVILEDWDNVIPEYRKMMLINVSPENHMKRINEIDKEPNVIKFRYTLNAQKDLIAAFKVTAIFLTIIIAVSLLFLPLSPYYKDSLWFSILMFSEVFFSILCLYLCLLLIVGSSHDKDSGKIFSKILIKLILIGILGKFIFLVLFGLFKLIVSPITYLWSFLKIIFRSIVVKLSKNKKSLKATIFFTRYFGENEYPHLFIPLIFPVLIV